MTDESPTRHPAGRRRRAAAALLLLGLVLACGARHRRRRWHRRPVQAPGSAPIREASSPPRKLHIAYATEASLTAPLWVTKDQGLFDKYGLDVDLTFIRGGATIMQSMIAGEHRPRAERRERDDHLLPRGRQSSLPGDHVGRRRSGADHRSGDYPARAAPR